MCVSCRLVEWLGDDAQLSRMSAAAKATALPTAACDIAERTLSMLKEALAVPLCPARPSATTPSATTPSATTAVASEVS